MNIFKAIREKVKLGLYDSKDRVLSIFKYLVVFVSLCSAGLLLYYYGFPQTGENKELILNLIKVSFSVYLLNFFLRWIYSLYIIKFIKDNWFEALLMFFLLIEGVSSLFGPVPFLQFIFTGIGIENFTPFIVIITQIYLWVIIALELGKASSKIFTVKLPPSTMLVLSFLVLILGGTVLLLLPEMSVQEGSMPFLEAIFTSTSASCVTGLIIVDTGAYYTFKGQVVLLLLMQAGGLNILTFATFFASLASKGGGVKQQSMVKEFTSSETLLSSKGLLRQIIGTSIVIEIIGFVTMYFSWESTTVFQSTGDKIFHSIFHAVSAFNNAGFSLYTDGFFEEHIRHSYGLHSITAFLIILGGLGFTTIKDIFSIKKIRERIRQPWRKPSISSRVSVFSALILIVVGTIIFYILEYDNSIEGYNFPGSIITSFFQSVTTRTAGFNTVDIGSLGTPMLIAMLGLMFIGASSGSTGGGIKTSTFSLLLVNAYSTLRGKKKIELFKRSISNKLLFEAFSILLFALSIVFLGIFLLSLTDGDKSLMQLAFEEVSAFATVGLSTGITADLSTAGKIIIMFSMFIGRIGTLTLAYALSKKAISTKYKYPEADLTVG